MVNTDKQAIHNVLTRGVETVLPTREALADVMASGKRLRLYAGIDPTAPFLHIGHALQLKKLREFQNLGHEVIWLFGTFTAMIGDPTDKMATRKQLTEEEVRANLANYKRVASKILRFRGENAVTIMRNDKWLAKMTLADVLALTGHFTVQQMMKRDMFAKRWEEQKEISMTEFMYPLMQGYDSVAMDVDLEIGGNDQLFNMLAGRTLQKAFHGKEKYVITLKLLTNDEGKKMSKSEGGFIAIDDTPEDMYGKIMAMNDSMIAPYFELVTDIPQEEIDGVRLALQNGANPRDLKMRLAKTVVAQFHNAAAAKHAEKHFVGVFQKKEMPDAMPEYKLEGQNAIVQVLVATGLASSNSEARRLIDQKGITLDDVSVTLETAPKPGVLRRGKRQFVRLV